jgi:hypothetical protein
MELLDLLEGTLDLFQDRARVKNSKLTENLFLVKL